MDQPFYTDRDKEAVRCPCGADDYTVRFVERGFNIVTCNRCTMCYVNPRLTREALKALYNMNLVEEDRSKASYYDVVGMSDATPPQAYIRDGRGRFEATFKFLEKHAPGRRLLDVGSGMSAQLVQRAKAHGFVPTAFELDTPLMQAAMQRLEERHGIKSVLADSLLEAGFPDASFDVVTLWEVFEHLPNQLEVLREVHRVLVPGGIIVLQLPFYTWLIAKVRILRLLNGGRIPTHREWPMISPIGMFGPEMHLYNYTHKTVRNLFAWSGFELVKFQVDRNYFIGSYPKLVIQDAFYYLSLVVNLLTRGGLTANVFLLPYGRKPRTGG